MLQKCCKYHTLLLYYVVSFKKNLAIALWIWGGSDRRSSNLFSARNLGWPFSLIWLWIDCLYTFLFYEEIPEISETSNQKNQKPFTAITVNCNKTLKLSVCSKVEETADLNIVVSWKVFFSFIDANPYLTYLQSYEILRALCRFSI